MPKFPHPESLGLTRGGITLEKTRRPLDAMLMIAHQIRGELAPLCERIEIAGSIRRERPDVGDVELVAVPRVEPTVVGGELFGRTVMCNHLVQYLGGRLACGDRYQLRLDAAGRPSRGERYMRLAVDVDGGPPVALDLFSVLPPAEWGVLFLIRTGPAEFSRRMVTHRSIGGWLPDAYDVRDGAVWEVHPGTHEVFGDGTCAYPGCAPAKIATPAEEDFFKLNGRVYLSPRSRTA